MKNFKKQYRNLEQNVIFELRNKVENSNHVSKHTSNQKSIKVDVFNYTELTIINDRLTFLDEDGYQYSLFTECDLEHLIDILYNN